MKKLLTLSMALIMVICSGSMAFAEVKDYDTNWAKNEIVYMKEKGIIQGYPDGSFKPSNNMAKAEFYSVINGLMGLTEKGEVEFLDVSSTDWYYEIVQKGVKAGYILPGTNLNPKANITRGEVARIISFVTGIEENKEAAKAFTDYADIPESLKGVIGGLKANDLVAGYPDGSFKANGEITRAEAVKLLHNISGEIVNVKGTVNKDASNNVLVNTADVVLKDMIIEGNLYLTEGIGEGDVTLDNVTVKGLVSIKGGGSNSIIIKNSTINNMLIEKTSERFVRVVLDNTKVEEIKTLNLVKLELKEMAKVKLVDLKGKVELTLEKGSIIDTVKADSKEITIDSEGTIKSLVTAEEIKVNGKTVKADTELKIEDGKSTEIKTTEVKSETSQPGQTVDTKYEYSTSTNKTDIVSKYTNRIKSLEATTLLKLSNLAVAAQQEDDTPQIREGYKAQVEALDKQVDADFEYIISALKSELKEYGYTDDVTAGLRAEYLRVREKTYEMYENMKNNK